MSTKIVYTANDRAIVDALRGSEGMTLSQLCEATGLDLKPGHIVSAMKKGLIAATGEVEVKRPGHREIGTYGFVTSEPLSDADGKAYNYTDGEKNVLSAAASIDGYFTLADLAKAMGVEKVYSGSINGLVKKGNIARGEKVQVETFTIGTNKVYSFVADIPADAE